MDQNIHAIYQPLRGGHRLIYPRTRYRARRMGGAILHGEWQSAWRIPHVARGCGWGVSLGSAPAGRSWNLDNFVVNEFSSPRSRSGVFDCVNPCDGWTSDDHRHHRCHQPRRESLLSNHPDSGGSHRLVRITQVALSLARVKCHLVRYSEAIASTAADAATIDAIVGAPLTSVRRPASTGATPPPIAPRNVTTPLIAPKSPVGITVRATIPSSALIAPMPTPAITTYSDAMTAFPLMSTSPHATATHNRAPARRNQCP